MMTQPIDAQAILEMRGISKRFPGLVALNGVDFSARRGEIHALIGQNGAGKSTLMKVLAGVYTPDDGTLLVEGEAVRFGHPRDALRMGIGTVYQDLSLVPRLSVADNLFLGREAGNGFVIDQKATREQAARILAELGIQAIPVDALVGDLPLAQQQLVEIAKVVAYRPRILVLDEPTAALDAESEGLVMSALERLMRGRTTVIIAHRLSTVRDADLIVVMNQGRIVEQGRHEALLRRGGHYARLVQLQLGDGAESLARIGAAEGRL